MRMKLTPIAMGLCLLGLVSVPVFADNTASSAPDEQQLINQLTQKTSLLEQQVQQLQAQLKNLKQAQHVTSQKAESRRAQYVAEQSKSYQMRGMATTTKPIMGPQPAGTIASEMQAAAIPGKPGMPPMTPLYHLGDMPLSIGGMPVVTAPYLGEHSAFDASDLLINIPSVNSDLRILQRRKKLQHVYTEYGVDYPQQPMVSLSGTVQAQGIGSRPYFGAHTSEFDVTDAEFDIQADINRWVTAFMDIAYDNTPPNAQTPPSLGPVVANSHLYMNKGFITIGNLASNPIYASIGQLYVPFGEYASNMVTDPMVKTLMRTKARALVMGYYNSWDSTNLNATVFTFRGDSTTGVSNDNKLNQFGGNLDYGFNVAALQAVIGTSYITNIADSLGMQETGAPTYTGFAGFSGGNPAENTGVLDHRVPGLDVHTTLSLGNYSFIGEYAGAFLQSFSANNLTFNGRGASPASLNMELAYNFPIWSKPSSIAIGYGQTKDALAFLLPERRYSAVLNTSIWKDTLESLEYRHDINYNASDTATGQGVPVGATGLGRTSDTLTAQVAVYF